MKSVRGVPMVGFKKCGRGTQLANIIQRTKFEPHWRCRTEVSSFRILSSLLFKITLLCALRKNRISTTILSELAHLYHPSR